MSWRRVHRFVPEQRRKRFLKSNETDYVDNNLLRCFTIEIDLQSHCWLWKCEQLWNLQNWVCQQSQVLTLDQQPDRVLSQHKVQSHYPFFLNSIIGNKTTWTVHFVHIGTTFGVICQHALVEDLWIEISSDGHKKGINLGTICFRQPFATSKP